MMFDAIVIGGSVAGAPTAMLLARKGHKVLLIERSIFPRDTNSTHFIWPRGMSYLNRWGLAKDILEATPHYKNLMINIEGINLSGHVPLHDLKNRFMALHGDDDHVINDYCGPRRYFLDNFLLGSALKAGVEVKLQTSYVSAILEKDTVKGITMLHNGNTYQAYAKIIIAADGRFSKFAKDVGAAFTDYREKSTFAYYSYFSGIDREELAIHKKGRLGTAIFPTLNATQMALVYGPSTLWADFKKNAEKNFFEIFEFCAPDIVELIKKGKRTENFKGCSQMHAFQRENFGKGWALIGDAASFKDQVTAMGITHAFRDADLIASCVHKALIGETSMPMALEKYKEKRAHDYIDYFNLVCKTAEMNHYTQNELSYFNAIKHDQDKVNEIISQFADTLPLS